MNQHFQNKKIRADRCAAPESDGARLSKTDWLDIALAAEIQPGQTLTFDTRALLAEMNRIAVPLRIKVCLVLIGNGLIASARRYFHDGADRVFVYDDLLFNDFRPNIYAHALQHFAIEYKPSLLIFPDSSYGRQLAAAGSELLRLPVMENAAAFALRSNRDLFLPGADPGELAQITASRPQLIIADELENRGEAIDDPGRRGELMICELPDVLMN